MKITFVRLGSGAYGVTADGTHVGRLHRTYEGWQAMLLNGVLVGLPVPTRTQAAMRLMVEPEVTAVLNARETR